ncbi:Molybdopterin biosynthesis MoaE [Chaetomium tenue]|uniref:Molybdopterin biosynthesis MoaE n=1 Tax=Chaetomium tenue TaxID=1854479 RepID=A0ACB7P354_9PEZI|nr:Molybdopterin biosynthesis MoaE [Chaetomium globosum]
MATPPTEPQEDSSLSQEGCYVALTSSPLSIQSVTDRVRSPQAGAIVLFAGTTRDTFASKRVTHLSYTAYTPLALNTMLSIATDLHTTHALQGIAMVHRLGEVPVGEESILIAVSAAHRQAAWRAGEAALEACKERVEVWKREEFADGEGVWRANRDGAVGERVG